MEEARQHSALRRAAGVVAGLLLAAAPLAADEAADAPVDLPSGRQVTFLDLIRDKRDSGLVYRFRFVAPDLEGSADFETAEGDMAYLCKTYALPRLSEIGPKPARIVISLSDRPVEFGASAPEAVQFFEAYRPEDGACIWEMF